MTVRATPGDGRQEGSREGPRLCGCLCEMVSTGENQRDKVDWATGLRPTPSDQRLQEQFWAAHCPVQV